MRLTKWTMVAVAVAALSACGGGGDGTDADAGAQKPAPETSGFNFFEAYKKRVDSGWRFDFNASASNGCSGAGSYVETPAQRDVVFEGKPALKTEGTLTIEYTNCTPRTIVERHIFYYDENYRRLADWIDDSAYGFAERLLDLPKEVKAGDSAETEQLAMYSSLDKTTKVGATRSSYQFEKGDSDDELKTVQRLTTEYWLPQGGGTRTIEGRLHKDGTLETLRWESVYKNGVVVTFQKK